MVRPIVWSSHSFFSNNYGLLAIGSRKMIKLVPNFSALDTLQYVDSKPNNHQSHNARQANAGESHSSIGTTRYEVIRRAIVGVLLQICSGLGASFVD